MEEKTISDLGVVFDQTIDFKQELKRALSQKTGAVKN